MFGCLRVWGFRGLGALGSSSVLGALEFGVAGFWALYGLGLVVAFGV